MSWKKEQQHTRDIVKRYKVAKIEQQHARNVVKYEEAKKSSNTQEIW